MPFARAPFIPPVFREKPAHPAKVRAFGSFSHLGAHDTRKGAGKGHPSAMQCYTEWKKRRTGTGAGRKPKKSERTERYLRTMFKKYFWINLGIIIIHYALCRIVLFVFESIALHRWITVYTTEELIGYYWILTVLVIMAYCVVGFCLTGQDSINIRLSSLFLLTVFLVLGWFSKAMYGLSDFDFFWHFNFSFFPLWYLNDCNQRISFILQLLPTICMTLGVVLSKTAVRWQPKEQQTISE